VNTEIYIGTKNGFDIHCGPNISVSCFIRNTLRLHPNVSTLLEVEFKGKAKYQTFTSCVGLNFPTTFFMQTIE